MDFLLLRNLKVYHSGKLKIGFNSMTNSNQLTKNQIGIIKHLVKQSFVRNLRRQKTIGPEVP